MKQNNNENKGILNSVLSCSLVAFLSFTTHLNAAEAEPTAEENVEEIVVTGTRLRITNANSAVPTQVLTSSDILEIGSTDLQDILADLPGVEIGVSDEGSTNSIQSNGLNTISLRRLGDDRSLVLVNGKRGVSNSGNSNRFDLSTLPTGFIESTNVTTGGASAVYGSDAIAGVVNISLEDDFEGNRITARYSTPEASGRDQRELSFLSGTTFNNDKGYILFGANILDRNPLFADSSRPETLLAIEFDDPNTSNSNDFADEINRPGCDPANEDRHCILPSFSGSTPGGVFENGDAWFVNGQWFNDQDDGSANTALGRDGLPRAGGRDFFSDFDGYNFREDRSLLAGIERENIAVNATYEFTPTLEGGFFATYSSNTSSSPRGYETLNHGDEFGPVDEDGDRFEIGNIASDHPFIPPEVEATRSGSVDFDRRLVELGQQTRSNDRETIRFAADLKGQLNFRNGFDWEIYGTYGEFTQESGVTNEYNIRNARHALRIESDGNGGFQCQNADARAAGCVPLDIFGEGTISQAAADYIRYNSFGVNELTQHSVGGYVSGDLFEIPAGQIKTVFGIEHRRDLQDTVGDPDSRLTGADRDPTNDFDIDNTDVDISSAAVFPDLKAEQSVLEVFGEVEIPIIEDKLYLQLAGRNADYDSVGSVQSFNFGGVWNATDYLKIRSQFSTAQRAPNLTELYSSPRPDSDDLDDPCEGLMADGSGLTDDNIGDAVPNADLAVISANCLAQTGIQAFFLDNPGDEFDPDDSTQGPNQGNPFISEESAETFTIGVIFQPDFIEDLVLAVDYYKIDIEDAIGSISTQDVVDLCYADPNFDPNSRFCAPITRNGTDGEVVEVINRQENLNNEIVEGIDVNFNYEMPAKRLFRNAQGDFEIDFRYTHYLTDETIFTGTDGTEIVTTFLGELNAPKDSYRFKFGYDLNDLRITWTTDYEPGGVDNERQDPIPEDNRYFAVDGEFFHRLYASYEFGEDDKYKISAGIDNVFDNAGPLVPQGTDSGDSYNIGTNVNDLVGRDYFIQFRASFK